MTDQPVIDIAIEPRSNTDAQKLGGALAQLAAADSCFTFKIDKDSGQTIVSGADELKLDAAIERLRTEFGLGVNLGAPQVAYRETIARRVEFEQAHRHESAGSGEFARIKFLIEPSEAGAGFAFVSEGTEGHLPSEYVAGVETGVRSVANAGPLIGFPVVGVRFVLLGGAYHDRDSSVLAFETAGRLGFKRAIEKAAPQILEPVMRVDVLTPEGRVGDVLGDLNSRRGEIVSTMRDGRLHRVTAIVPMGNLLGYMHALRALTDGLGSYSTRFDHYARVPDHVDPDGRFPPAAAMRIA